MADRTAEPLLQRVQERCLSTCGEVRSYATCADRCGCMVGEMARHWDMDELRERLTRLQADAQDSQIQDEMSRLASYCAQRGQ